MNEWFTIDNVEHLTEQYKQLGPLVGILFPMIEAFLPFLPLVVFVVANASAFGLGFGFLLSWLGTVLGSYLVFLLVHRFGRHPKMQRIVGGERVQSLIRWVDMRGLSPLFVLLCLPFTPSVIVNVVAGLSNIRKKYYLIVLAAGKFVMIFSMSFIGHDLRALLTSPLKMVLALLAIIILWAIGKFAERQLNKRVARDLQQTDSSEK